MVRQLVTDILRKGNLTDEEVAFMTSPASMEVYNRAFRAPSADPVSNYEDLEFLGDATLQTFIPWYVYQRFPQIACAKGVTTLSRLNCKYRSKEIFAMLGTKLGFLPAIKASPLDKVQRREQLLEDVFEAFIGATHRIIDDQYGFGVGYVVASKVLRPIFDDLQIDLTYENLWDNKSRLIMYMNRQPTKTLITNWDNNERLLTMYMADKPTIRTVPSSQLSSVLREYDPRTKLTITMNGPTATLQIPSSNKMLIGTSKRPTRAKAEQEASRQALIKLNVKDELVNYDFMCQ